MIDLFKSLKLTFLIFWEYNKRNWQLTSFFIILVLILAFIQFRFNFLLINPLTVSQGLVGTYQEHDLPLEVTKLISEGLTKIDNQGRVIPNLVSGWEVNNDATIFKFKIKDNLFWSDGTKVLSSDLEIPIPNTEISFSDENIIEFKLKESYSPFPSLLTRPILKKGTLIGIGPFKITKIEKSRIFITKVKLEPKDHNLPNVVIRFYPSENIAQTGFALGEVQSLLGITSQDNINYSNLIKLQEKVDYTKIVTIFYNMDDPLLAKDNRSLRQALSFSAPIIEGEIEASSPIPPFSWAINTDLKNYLNNLGEAKNALEKAKTTSSKDLLEKELVLTTTPQLASVGKKIIAAWQDLGIKTVLRVESGIPQNFQALLITQSIPVDPDQYFLWHSTQSATNLTNYSFARVDKDLEDGRKALREEDRKVKYADFQRVLLEDSPATFLYFPKYNVLYLKKVEENLNKILPIQLSHLSN